MGHRDKYKDVDAKGHQEQPTMYWHYVATSSLQHSMICSNENQTPQQSKMYAAKERKEK